MNREQTTPSRVARWAQNEEEDEGIYPNLGVQELYFEEDFEEPMNRSKPGKK